MTRYYKIDSRKITFGEYWNISRNKIAVLLPWLCKIVGVQLNFSIAFPEPTTLRDRTVEKSHLLPDILRNLEAGMAELTAFGFHAPCFFSLKNLLMPGETGGVLLFDESGEVGASVTFVKYRGRECRVVGFISVLNDGSVLSTTDKRPEYNPPPGIEVQRIMGATPQQLWSAHHQTLEKYKVSNPPRKFVLPDAYEELFDQVTRKMFEHNVRRGLWVEMTPEEISAARQKLPPATIQN
jgi:hypothetical protein